MVRGHRGYPARVPKRWCDGGRPSSRPLPFTIYWMIESNESNILLQKERTETKAENGPQGALGKRERSSPIGLDGFGNANSVQLNVNFHVKSVA